MWYNPIIRWILRSPLHGLISKDAVLITYTGRKSGKVYTLPVNYARDGDTLLVTSYRHRTWWRNLRDDVEITVWLQGQDFRARGKAVEDDEGVRKGLMAYLQKVPQYARYYQVTVDPDGQPNAEDITRAAQNRVIVQIQLV